jgi:hypothetical protein
MFPVFFAVPTRWGDAARQAAFYPDPIASDKRQRCPVIHASNRMVEIPWELCRFRIVRSGKHLLGRTPLCSRLENLTIQTGALLHDFALFFKDNGQRELSS